MLNNHTQHITSAAPLLCCVAMSNTTSPITETIPVSLDTFFQSPLQIGFIEKKAGDHLSKNRSESSDVPEIKCAPPDEGIEKCNLFPICSTQQTAANTPPSHGHHALRSQAGPSPYL
ncbi:hypothetical protein FKM82_028637 [Ascaphus truei]